MRSERCTTLGLIEGRRLLPDLQTYICRAALNDAATRRSRRLGFYLLGFYFKAVLAFQNHPRRTSFARNEPSIPDGRPRFLARRLRKEAAVSQAGGVGEVAGLPNGFGV